MILTLSAEIFLILPSAMAEGRELAYEVRGAQGKTVRRLSDTRWLYDLAGIHC